MPPLNLTDYDTTNTTLLYFVDSGLTGTIPSEIGLYSNLNYLFLDTNYLSGTIPSEIGSLSNLIELQINTNELSGSIPTQLCVFPNLELFYVGGNFLSGSIPTQLLQLTNLIEIGLSYSSFTGTIPSQFGRLSLLEVFFAPGNMFSGSLPSELGMISRIQLFDLGENSMSGSITSQLGMWAVNEFFVANENNFTGSIPSQLGMMNATLGFDLASNHFTGSIPSQLGMMTQMSYYLDISVNKFSFELPSQLGLFSNLVSTCEEGYECFATYSNRMCGDIPSQLGALSVAYDSNGINYWLTFVLAGNDFGTSCYDPSPFPTSLPSPHPTSSPILVPSINKNSKNNNDDGDGEPFADSVVAAAIGSLLFLGLLCVGFISRKAYLYSRTVNMKKKEEVEADWASSNPMAGRRESRQSNPALSNLSSSHSKPGGTYARGSSSHALVPLSAANAQAMVIPFDRLSLNRKAFAAGASGSIFKGSYNGVAVAAKMLFSYSGDKEREEFDREFRMLSTLRHPNIVALYGMSHDPDTDQLYIVQEFVDGGNLYDLSRDKDKFSIPIFVSISLELFGALEYMHGSGVAHRDLKPLNMLVTASGSLRICDLGLARNYQQSSITANVGTALYMPPEAFDDCATSDPSYDATCWDIYSTGVILYELWYRGHPWEKFQTMQIFGRLARKNRPPFQPLFDGGPGGNIPKPLEELISKLWKDAPSDRPPISKAAEEFRAHVIPLLLGGEGGGGSLMSVPDPKDQSDVVLVSDPDFDIPPPPEQVPSPQSTAI